MKLALIKPDKVPLESDLDPFAFTVPAKDASAAFKILQKHGIVTNSHPKAEINICTEMELPSKVNKNYVPVFNEDNPGELLLSRVYKIACYRNSRNGLTDIPLCSKALGIPENSINNILLLYF